MRLASLRQGKESFSEIINRVTQKKRLMDFAGILSKDSADRMEKNIRKFRKAYNKNAKRRVERIHRELS